VSENRSAALPDGWLDTMLNPRAVAIVGASDVVRSPGGRIMLALQKYGFKGHILPVNPNRTEILGYRCFASLAELPETPDVAILVVSAKASVSALAQCAELGIHNVIIGSSGYAETGPEGAAIQSELEAIARANAMVLIGPNTNGVINCTSRFTGSFTPALQQDSYELRDGPIAIVSQSGALGATFFYLAQRSGLGASILINTGNEILVSSEDAIAALVGPDSPTQVVLTYTEGLRRPSELIRAAELAHLGGRTICMLKVGNTEAGAQAAAAHTANLAGEDRVYAGVLRQLGIIRANSVTGLVDIGRVLAAYGPQIGHRLTIASMSGGLGIMITDLASGRDIELADWPIAERAKFDDWLPGYLSRANPIDVAGVPFFDLDLLEKLVRTIESNPSSDASVLAICNFEQLQESITKRLIAIRATLHKPLFVVWLGGDEAIQRLNAAGIPAFPDADTFVSALAAITTRRAGSIVSVRRSEPVAFQSEPSGAASAGIAADPESALVQSYGVNLAVSRTIDSVTEVEHALRDLRLPVVAKLVSPQVLHKSDVGGVLLGLDTAAAVAGGVETILSRASALGIDDARVLLQEQVPAGLELLLGMKHDATFGPVVTFGLGGVLAEALDDVQIRLPFIEEADIADMLAGLTHRKLLSGYRGLPAAEPAALAPIVLAFCRMIRAVGDQFDAIEINPVVVPIDGSPPIGVDLLAVRRVRSI
jgi:acyl-CoA synthetase (NDP forming)